MSFRPRIAAAALMLLLSLSLNAQVGGTISGTVKDTTDGIITGAAVVITNVDTGVERQLAVNQSGAYGAPNLRPGTYKIVASAPGFKTVERKSVVLDVGADLTADFELPVGAVNERVEVSANIGDVEQSRATLDYTVNSTTVRELPLDDFDFGSYQN